LLIGNRVFVVWRGLCEFAGLASARDSGFDEGPPLAGGVIRRAAPVGIGIDAVGVLQGDGVDDNLAKHIVGAWGDDIGKPGTDGTFPAPTVVMDRRQVARPADHHIP